MKNKTKLAVVFLMVLVFVLSGCQKAEDENVNKTENQEEEQNVIEEADEYAYKDVICDSSLTKGQFAAYFFRSNYQNRLASKGKTNSGDSTLLITPDGKTMLIDVNLRPVTGRVLDYLNRLGIKKLDYLVFTHTDVDHYSGYKTILDNIEIGELFINDSPNWKDEKSAYGRCISAFKEKGVPVTVLKEGMSVEFGDVKVDCLWPMDGYEFKDEDGRQNQNMVNCGSLLLKFVYKDSSYLFGGDLYSQAELQLVDKYGDALQADIVKMNHHGSTTSNTAKWVAATSAKLVCGMNPTESVNAVIQRYIAYEIPFTISTQDGTVVVYTDGDGEYDVQVEKDRIDPFYPELNAVKGHFTIK